MGERAIDLTGQRFGKLFVIERGPNRYSSGGFPIVMWKCLCDCQKDKNEPEYVYKRGVELRRGNGLSCGCDIKEKQSKAQTKNLVGQKFGRLNVLEYAGTKIYGENENTSSALWKCLCDCQLNKNEKDIQYTYVTTNSLTTSNTQSCGCYWQERLIEALHNRKTQNEYQKKNGYYIGYTKKGEEFYVDEEDYDLVKEYKWFIDENGYVVAHPDDNSFIYMHRIIMGLQSNDNLEVDHIRGDQTTNDNRRINLRIATHSKNQMNRKKQSNNTSGITGVWYSKSRQRWIAEIMANGKKYHLGQYKALDEAADVRREAENILHGDYSYRNSQLEGNKKLQELENMQEQIKK